MQISLFKWPLKDILLNLSYIGLIYYLKKHFKQKNYLNKLKLFIQIRDFNKNYQKFYSIKHNLIYKTISLNKNSVILEIGSGIGYNFDYIPKG